MASQVIETDTHVWVAGVSWLTFAARPPTKDLIQLARDSNSGLVAMRNAGAFQVGFCQLDKAPKVKKKPLLCLAPAVSMSRAVPWRGIFDLGGGLWWYVAVRDNFMLTIDGDVVGDRDLIDSIAQSHAYYDDWDEYEGTLADALESATQADSPKVGLTSSSAGPARVVAIGAIAVSAIALAAYGGFLFAQHEHLKEVQEQAAAARAKALAMARQQQAIKAQKPATLAVDPTVFLRGCAKAMLATPLVHQGWELQSLDCRPGMVTASWKMHEGANKAFIGPQDQFSSGTRMLVQHKAVPNAINIVMRDDAARARAQLQVLEGRLNAAGFAQVGQPHKFELVANAPDKQSSRDAPMTSRPAIGAGLKNPKPPIQAAKQISYPFTVQGPVDPALMGAILQGLQGLTMQSVAWGPAGGWIYKGQLQ